METAIKAREQGLIRFIGVTGHNWVEVAKAAATGLFDTVLCWYNCAMQEPEETVFVQAQKHNMGVVIMSATRMTKLLDAEDKPPLEDFYRYVLGHPAVSLSVMGLRSVEDFRGVVKALSERVELEPGGRERMEAFGAMMRAKKDLFDG